MNQYTAGVQTAADGAHSAKDGSAQLAAGTKTLYDGVNTLNTGAGQLNDGAGRLNDGLNQFNEEGISKLTGALDQDQLHGLKTVLDEMTDRLNDYTSFAGAPDDAESSVKFVYKTAETVAAADTTACLCGRRCSRDRDREGRQHLHPSVAAHREPVQVLISHFRELMMNLFS